MENEYKKFFDTIKKYEPEQYQEEPLVKLTIVGILKLHDAKTDASFENITVILHKLFPEKFSLVNFPQYPDSNRVFRAMTIHCLEAGYVEGTLKTNSYLLTGKGQTVAEEVLEKIESGSKSDKKRSELKRNKYIRLVKGVTDTSGFKKFASKDFKQIKKFDVCESLHCTMDADEDHIKKNLETLAYHANNTKKISSFTDVSQSVIDYLEYIKSHWEKLLNE